MIPGQETIDVNHTELPPMDEPVPESDSATAGEPSILDHISPESDLVDTLERIISNKDNIEFASNYIPGLDGIGTDEIQAIISTVLDTLREDGVELFSAGDAGRATKIRSFMSSTGVYLKTIAKFVPIFHLTRTMLAARKVPDMDMTDDDWAAVSLTQPMAPAAAPVQGQGSNPQQRIDPESLINMPTPGQPGQPPNRQYSGYGSQPPGSQYPQQQQQQQQGMLSWESLINNHMAKHGSQGMNKALAELRERNIDVNVDVSPQMGAPVDYSSPNASWELEKRQAARYGVMLPDNRDGMSLVDQQRQAQRQQNLLSAPPPTPQYQQQQQQQQPMMPQQQQQQQPQPQRGPPTQSEVTSSGLLKPTDASMATMAQNMAAIDFEAKVQNKNNIKQMPDFLLDEIY